MGIAMDMKKLKEDLIASYDIRVRSVEEVVSGTRKMLKGFTHDREKMSAEQAKTLADFVSGLVVGVADMLGGFQKEHKDMSKDLRAMLKKATKDVEVYVKNKLKEFSEAHADMSVELKKNLSKFVSGIVHSTKKLLSDYKGEREELSAELNKMSANWKAMTNPLAKKRPGMPIKIETESKSGTVEETIKPRKKKAKKGGK
jgi:hypothetical protein